LKKKSEETVDSEEKVVDMKVKTGKRKPINSTFLFQFVTLFVDMVLLACYVVYIVQGRFDVTKYFTYSTFRNQTSTSAT